MISTDFCPTCGAASNRQAYPPALPCGQPVITEELGEHAHEQHNQERLMKQALRRLKG